MQWQSLSEFIDMGGRGGFVWGAYGTTAVSMLLEQLLVRARHRAARRALVHHGDDEAATVTAPEARA